LQQEFRAGTTPPGAALDALSATGRSRLHIVELPALGCALHRAAVEPFLAMRGAALAAGIDLAVASSFRDFDRQSAIWNAKFRGERPMLDRTGAPLTGLALEPPARIEAILWWSALPGASRHHWGSDLDVYDAAALPAGAKPELVPAEFARGGPFARLDLWLRHNMRRFGFFRPYESERDGVSPEPWHLSFAPVAVPTLQGLTLEALAGAIAQSGIEGRDDVLAALPRIHAQYVVAIDAPRDG
jgi:LAS superfamily LD-carboxypeptidase LdcB